MLFKILRSWKITWGVKTKKMSRKSHRNSWFLSGLNENHFIDDSCMIIASEHEHERDWIIVSTVTCPIIKGVCTCMQPGYCIFFVFSQTSYLSLEFCWLLYVFNGRNRLTSGWELSISVDNNPVGNPSKSVLLIKMTMNLTLDYQ